MIMLEEPQHDSFVSAKPMLNEPPIHSQPARVIKRILKSEPEDKIHRSQLKPKFSLRASPTSGVYVAETCSRSTWYHADCGNDG